MIIELIFLLIFVFTAVRAVVYGVYAVKNESVTGGVGMFIMAATVGIAGYFMLF